MKLNPILYLTKESALSEYLKTLINDAASRSNSQAETEVKALVSFYELLSHLKPYQGNIIKNGKNWKQKTFYR